MTELLPPIAQAVYDEIDRLAGARGTLHELPWANGERANYQVGANDVIEDGRLSNGTFVGLWSPANGVPVDNLVVRNVELLHSRRWASRPYEWRDGNVWEGVTVCGVLEEHGLYPTMIGRGTYGASGGERPLNHVPSLTLRRCRWEYIGSQAIQLTGPRHLLGQNVGTAPNGTGFPFELADTAGGPIVVENNIARAVCSWGTQAAFAYSFREAKHAVVIDGLVVDTRGFEPEGGVLFEGGVSAIATDPAKVAPWFPRAVDARRMVVAMGRDATPRPLVQADHISWMRLVESAFYAEGGNGIVRVTRKDSEPGRLVIANCIGNVRVRIDGDDAGPIEGQRIDLRW